MKMQFAKFFGSMVFAALFMGASSAQAMGKYFIHTQSDNTLEETAVLFDSARFNSSDASASTLNITLTTGKNVQINLPPGDVQKMENQMQAGNLAQAVGQATNVLLWCTSDSTIDLIGNYNLNNCELNEVDIDYTKKAVTAPETPSPTSPTASHYVINPESPISGGQLVYLFYNGFENNFAKKKDSSPNGDLDLLVMGTYDEIFYVVGTQDMSNLKAQMGSNANNAYGKRAAVTLWCSPAMTYSKSNGQVFANGCRIKQVDMDYAHNP